MKNFEKSSIALLVIAAFLSGCSSTTVARNFNGVPTTEGEPIGHISTSNVAIHLLLGKNPVWGDASLPKTVEDFTAAAKAERASKVRIVQSKRMNWWFIFFPFTLLITPVTSNVAGDAIA
ncbi:MAG: hypothetical protein HYZ83_02880 [Candidatus Omnitrophica bacterium]|nr:hypothetical protein [Candidatus Omnitrophota bacterium]